MNRLLTRLVLPIIFLIALTLKGEANDFFYDGHGQRDPFWPLVSPRGAIINYDSNFSISEMVLEGIIADGGGRLAIINGLVVEEGQKLGSSIIQKIMPNQVIVVKDGNITVLRLKKEE